LVKWKRFLFWVERYGFFIIFAGILAIIIIVVRNHMVQHERITVLEAVVQEQITRQTELLLEAGLATEEALEKDIADSTAATDSRITITNERIRQMNAVYAGILAELEKRTLDSLYSENILMETEQEARTLFLEGKYLQASVKYELVAEAQPENVEARFFYLYSLFLNNKLNRSNYRRIKEGLQALERNGYLRAEIRETLRFIEMEERGLATGVAE